jgi:hypothetical protein
MIRYPITRWLDWLKNECGLKTDAFIVDCAEAESHAIGTVFPEIRIHYCDFHVGQLWEKQLVKFSVGVYFSLFGLVPCSILGQYSR